MTQTQQPEFQSSVVKLAYRTLFGGGNRKPSQIDGAIYNLMDMAADNPEADQVLTRAFKEGKHGHGNAKKRLIALMASRNAAAAQERAREREAYRAQRREASKAKQARNAANRLKRGQADASRKPASGGGKSQNEGKGKKKGH